MKCNLVAILILLVISGCSALPMTDGSGHLPPVLTLEETSQQYTRLGRIIVTRTVYFTDYTVTPSLHEWALHALSTEAGKLEADAVILPEISSRELSIFIFPAFPATEYRAAGVAIKFVK